MAQKQTLAIRIDADGRAAITEMDKVDRKVRDTGDSAKGATSGFNALGASLNKMAVAATAAGAALGTAVAGKAVAITTETAAAAAATDRYSQALGVSVEQLSAFQSAVGRTGIQADQAGDILKDVAEKIGDAYANGGGEAVEALENLGIAVGDIAKLNPVDQLTMIAEAMGDIGTQGEKIQIAESLANDLTLLLPLFDNNAEKLREFMDEADRLGSTITGEELAVLKDLTAETKTLGAAWEGVSQQIAVQVAPALADVYELTSGLLADIDLDAFVGDISRQVDQLANAFGGWTDTAAQSFEYAEAMVVGLGQALINLENPLEEFYDGLSAMEGKATVFEQLIYNVQFAGQAFLDLPTNLTAAVQIILAEVDILGAEWDAGFDQLLLSAQSTWNGVVATASEWFGKLKVVVAEVVAWIATQLNKIVGAMAGVVSAANKLADFIVPDGFEATLKTASAGLVVLGKSGEIAAAGQDALAEGYADTTRKIEEQKVAVEAQRVAEVARFEAIRDAAFADRDAKKVQAEAQAELAEAMEGAIDDTYDLDSGLKELEKTEENLVDQTDKVVKKLAGSGGGGGGGGGSIKTASDEAGRALKRLQTDVDALISRYLPAEAAARRFAEAQTTINAALETHKLSQAQATEITAAMREEMDRAADDADDAAGQFETAWEDAVDVVDSSFQSMWSNLIDGTAGTLSDMAGMIKRWLAQLAHSLITQPLTVALTAGFTGASGAAGAATSAASGIGGIGQLGGIGNLFGGSGIGQFAARGLDSFSTNILGNSLGSGSLFQAGTNLAAIPNWAFGAGGILGGLAGGMLFNGGASGIGSGIGSTAGSLLGGALIGGPVGALAGGLFGGLGGGFLGSLFGGGRDPAAYLRHESIGIGGFEDGVSVGGNDLGLRFGLAGASYDADPEDFRAAFEASNQIAQAIAEVIGDNASADVRSAMEQWQAHRNYDATDSPDAAFAEMWDNIFDFVGAHAGEVGALIEEQLGNLPANAEAATAKINDVLTSVAQTVALTEAVAESSVGAFLGMGESLSENIAIFEEMTAAFVATGLTSEEAAQRLIQSIDVFGRALDLTSVIEDGLDPQAFAAAGNELINFAGGYDVLLAGMQTYYSEFFSAEEQREQVLAQANEAIADALGELGIAVPGTREKFIALVESLDLGTESGRQTFAVLQSVAGAFDVVYDAAEAAEQQADDLAAALRAQIVAYAETRDALAAALDPLSDDENLALVSDELTSLGYSGEIAADAIAEWVRGIDTTTSSGRGMIDALDELGGSLEDAIEYVLSLADASDELPDGTDAGPTALQREQLATTLEQVIGQIRPATNDENLGEINALLGDLGHAGNLNADAVAAWIATLDTSTDAGYAAAEAVAAHAGSIQQAIAYLESAASAERMRIAAINDGMDALAASVEPMKTLADLTAEAGAVFDEIGVEMPKTSDAFYEFLQTADLTELQMMVLVDSAALLTQAYQEQAAAEQQRIAAITDGMAALAQTFAPVRTLSDLMADAGAVFARIGVRMPSTSDAFYDFITAVELTEEQMQILVQNSNLLTQAYSAQAAEAERVARETAEELQRIADEAEDRRQDLARAAAAEMQRLARENASRMADIVRQEQEAQNEALREIEEERRRIEAETAARHDFISTIRPEVFATSLAFTKMREVFSAWGYDIPATSGALYELISSGKLTETQVLALSESSEELSRIWEYTASAQDAVIDRYREEIQVHQDLASEIESTISTIDSALASLVAKDQDPAISLANALTLIEGGSPGNDLNAAIARASNVDANNFATAFEYETAIDTSREALEGLRDRMTGQLSAAEEQIRLVEDQINKLDEGNALQQATIDAIEEQSAVISRAVLIAVGTARSEAETDARSAASLAGVRGYATGGYFPGGLRIVGEYGPELEYTGPSNISNADQTRRILGYDELIAEIKRLRSDVNSGNRAVAIQSMKSAKVLTKWDIDGQPLERT